MYDPETQAKIQIWRQKALAGELTLEESREAIAVMRQGRLHAAEVSAKSRTKASGARAKAAVNSDSLLSELEEL